jgi:hypothetical protein
LHIFGSEPSISTRPRPRTNLDLKRHYFAAGFRIQS